MTTRMIDNQMKVALFVVIFLVGYFMDMSGAAAQGHPRKKYVGLAVSYGNRSHTLSSDIAKINNTTVSQSGAQISFVYGTSIVRSRIGLLGYYTSDNRVPGTVDLFVNNASLSFFPLAAMQRTPSRFQPYVNAGISYDRMKFYGHYLSNEPGRINYSSSEAPYIGKINQLNSSVGTGLQVSLLENYTFVHLFSEVRYLVSLGEGTSTSALAGTTSGRQWQVNFGIAFGARR